LVTKNFDIYRNAGYYNNKNALLTPWSRVLLEKLTGFAVSQKIPRIYGTPKFITALPACEDGTYRVFRNVGI
jgi:hypothetical protein